LFFFLSFVLLTNEYKSFLYAQWLVVAISTRDE
jgi:hypothetical protein